MGSVGTNRYHYYQQRYRLSVCAGLIALLLCLSKPSLNVVGQTSATTSMQYTFGQSVTFTLTLTDSSSYDNYNLYFSASGINTTSHTGQLTNNTVTLTRDLRNQPLPPFSHITYWWEYTDNHDTLITTEKKTFQYIDNRFEWQTYSDKGIHLFWVQGDKSTLINSTAIAWDTLTKVQHALQTTITPDIDVYFYPSTPDLQSALQLAGYEWIAGAAYPELGVIILSVAEGNQALSQIQRILPHELTHKILYDVYGAEGYEHIAEWLIEGLASYFEPTPDPAYALIIEDAVSSSTLLPVETLCFPFPDEHRTALLSYAQSESITRYIQQKNGWSSIRSLLHIYADEGVDCAAGLQEILHRTPAQFDREWRVWLETDTAEDPQNDSPDIFKLTPEMKAAWSIFLNDAARWLVVFAVLAIPFLIFSLQLVIKKIHQNRG